MRFLNFGNSLKLGLGGLCLLKDWQARQRKQFASQLQKRFQDNFKQGPANFLDYYFNFDKVRPTIAIESDRDLLYIEKLKAKFLFGKKLQVTLDLRKWNRIRMVG